MESYILNMIMEPPQRAETSRESAGAAGAVPANHPTPETLHEQLFEAIRGNTHPVERGTRRFANEAHVAWEGRKRVVTARSRLLGRNYSVVTWRTLARW